MPPRFDSVVILTGRTAGFRKEDGSEQRLLVMTTMHEIDVRCAVCGVLGRKAELTSTSSFGPPDLDLRPNGPARWALPFKVQRCDACGYCADPIASAPPGAKDVVESVVYRDVLERSKLPALARSYFCAALVEEAATMHEAAGWSFLHAAATATTVRPPRRRGAVATGRPRCSSGRSSAERPTRLARSSGR